MDRVSLATILMIGLCVGGVIGQASAKRVAAFALDVVAGMIGALAGGVLVPESGFMGGSNAGILLASVLGAVAVLLSLHLLRRALLRVSGP